MLEGRRDRRSGLRNPLLDQRNEPGNFDYSRHDAVPHVGGDVQDEPMPIHQPTRAPVLVTRPLSQSLSTEANDRSGSQEVIAEIRL